MIDLISQYEIAIAALFHDIGKFKQRAYGGNTEHICNEALIMEGQVLPFVKAGYYSHKHALWTLDFFIRDFIPLLNRNPKLAKLNGERIARAASFHHKPEEGNWSEIIAIADRASAESDRAFMEEYEKGKYLRTPLRSIFSSLSLQHHEEIKKSPYTYELKPLNDSDAMFPIENGVITEDSYYSLYDEFINALLIAIAQVESPRALLSKLLDLMYEYTWCIPSATNDYLNDISLFDHSKTTMVIALAIACSEDRDKPIRACAVGVSGIQSFIFQSKHASFKNAARIFRGRSFIVAFMSTAFKEFISNGIGVIPFFDCIDAGGNVTFLLPNYPGIDEKLRELQYQAEKFLLEKYYGTLSIVMDYSSTIAADELGVGKFLLFYRSMGKKLSFVKNRRFYSALTKGDYSFDFDLDKEVCTACGKRGSDLDGLCAACREQYIIGKMLPSCNTVSLSTKEGAELLPGIHLYFSDVENSNPTCIQTWSIGSSHDFNPVWRINNYVAEVSDFKEIAQAAVSEDGFGKNFLAYVKIDVDSLGKLVMEGQPEKTFSVSRFATFSRALHFFFNEYTRNLLEKEFPSAYTALSGGDDVFVIMPWNEALDFAGRLRKEFSLFCYNKELHFSAGIVLAHPNTPFALVNEKTNEALDEKSKEFNGKDAVTYLDVTFPMGKLEEFRKECAKLSGMVRRDRELGKPITKGLLNRLYQYAQDMLSDDNIALKYSVPSKLRYDLARNLQPIEPFEENYIEAMRFILNKFNNYDSIKDVEIFKALLVHVIYENRKTPNEEDIEWL